ncbi:MAG: acetyl-CoA C-acyltransferase [Candidatus Niyogibacteria bacterium]|nr:acetyl-CoA C-acyltransferase [Candidatus Niyogibacteria bacterium]
MKKVVIVSAVRTPVGKVNGKLSQIPATKLGAIVIEEAVRRANLKNKNIDEVIMGNVLPLGLGQNPARQAMLLAGLSVETAAFTINKVCGSGLMAVMLGVRNIMSGEAEIVVAGGMENMSIASRTDHMNHDGLWDTPNDCHMGLLAEFVAEEYRITRNEANKFAVQSYQKALRAINDGKFKEEIVPIGDFDKDEVPRETTMGDLIRLQSAFKDWGQVTAGNASKNSDGAATVVLMTEEKAQKLGIEPLARIVAQGTSGVNPKYALIAPIFCIPKTLKKAGLDEKYIDLHEINEAFSTTTVAVVKKLGIDEKKVNVRGGAVALGHPIGASGARILVTLLYAIRDYGVKTGMASLCIGGGEAVSLIVERP